MSTAQSALSVRPKSIVFATDLSYASENALRHAIGLTQHYGAALHMAHVVSSLGFSIAGSDAVGLAHDAATRDLRSLEDQLCRDGLLDRVEHDITVRCGDTWPELERLLDEKRADLLVIGTHGRRGLGRLLLGSVAEEIVRCARIPVVTVGPAFSRHDSLRREPRPVIFATDFQPSSTSALAYAAEFARDRDVKLVLLHVLPVLPAAPKGEWEWREDFAARRSLATEDTVERMKKLLHEVPQITPDVECVVRFGEPAEEILKLARDARADAIAMGLRRAEHPQAVSHFRSSIAYEVVCRANCAVLTTRH